MKAEIVFRGKGRLRARVKPYSISKGRALALEERLLSEGFVTSAKVTPTSGSILILYSGDNEQSVIKLIESIDLGQLDERELTPLMQSDERFKRGLEKRLVKRALVTLFVPMPIRKLFIAYRAFDTLNISHYNTSSRFKILSIL
jgi:hypothetical protein